MSKTVRNIQRVLIGGTANITTSPLNATFVANTGEIGIFFPDGRRMTAALAATAKQFIVAQSRGVAGEPKLLVSDVIDVAGIKGATAKVYTAATQQVDYIGYNGTSGSIEVNADELYMINIYLEEFITSSHDGRYIKHGQFNSSSSSTQANIADGLTVSLTNNFAREPKQLIKFERVNSAPTGSVTTAATGTLTATYGSKIVTASGGTPSTDFVSSSAGTYVRFGTALTSPVYKVVGVDDTGNGFITLDQPYQGANATFTAGNAEFILAAAVGDSGIKLTGVAQPWSLERKFYKLVRWTTGLSEDAFGATVVTKSVGAKEGSGEYRQVAELERFFQRNDNDNYRIGQPDLFDPRNDATSAVTGGGYDIVQITYVQAENVGFVDNISPKLLTIATPATVPNYAASGTADDIYEILDVLAPGGTLNTIIGA